MRQPAMRTPDPHGKPIFPIALYMDGVRFTKTIAPGHMDSLMNLSVYNLMTKRRHFLGMIRQSEFCRCSCAGWCTLYPVMSFLAWSFKHALSGERPRCRHDGSPFPAGDPLAIAAEAQPHLSSRFVLAQVKADWAEHCSALGFPTWASLNSYCLCGHVRRMTCLTFKVGAWWMTHGVRILLATMI